MTPIDKALLYLNGNIDMDAEDINATALVIRMMAQQAILTRDSIEKTLCKVPKLIAIGDAEKKELIKRLDEKIAYAQDLIIRMHKKYEESDSAGTDSELQGPGTTDTDRNGQADNCIGSNGDQVIAVDGGTVSQAVHGN